MALLLSLIGCWILGCPHTIGIEIRGYLGSTIVYGANEGYHGEVNWLIVEEVE